jgi:starch phosphorylase
LPEWLGDGQAQWLDPDALTLGFVRRFAEYKRTNLLLREPERLPPPRTDRDRPVQLVIAGKAHPRDADGKRMIREWFDYLQRPEVRGRVVFVKDHDLTVAAALTRGVDVWINTPRRPWQASGTAPADRPLSDYTLHIVPEHAAAALSLEVNLILWHQ